jgi:hypothetical protein
LSESIGVAGGELASTLVVSRIVISVENDRPQGHRKREPLLILTGAGIDAEIGTDSKTIKTRKKTHLNLILDISK